MGRVLTNITGLSYAIEDSLAVPNSTASKTLNPTAINEFGATTELTAPEPISRSRARRRGKPTDRTSAVGFDHSWTIDSFRDFIQGFMFSVGENTDVTGMIPSAVTSGPNEYTGFTAFTADQVENLIQDALLWVRGAVNADNNGLKRVGTAVSAGQTAIPVGETLVAETSTDIRVSFAGYRVVSGGTAPTWVYDAPTGRARMTAGTGFGTNMMGLGLQVGMFVHIGSIAEVRGAIQNAFTNTATDDMYGYARVVDIETDAIIFDKLSDRLQFTDDPGPTTDVDMVFGEFIRDVDRDDPRFLERSFTFEAEYPNLANNPAGDEYEYARGNYCNTMALSLPLNGLATIAFGFVGTDTDDPTTTRLPAFEPANNVDPDQMDPLSTAIDVARLRVTDVDEAGLMTDFKTLTFTINNNVAPENVIATLGARFMNYGTFAVDMTAQALFLESSVLTAIRTNEPTGLDFVLRSDDGAIAVDIPEMSLGGGDREFPVNETVLINTTGTAYRQESTGMSVGVSVFPVPFAAE